MGTRRVGASLLVLLVAGSGGCAAIGDLAGFDEAPEEEGDGNKATDPQQPAPDDVIDAPAPSPCTEGDARIHAASGQCYAYFGASVSWQQARDNCRALTGDLVRIESAAEQTLVEPLIERGRQNGFDEIWLGGNDLAVEGTFVWGDTTPLTFTFFRSGQPDGGRNENCLVADLDDDNRWDDRNCGDRTGSICQRFAGIPLQ